MLVTAVSAFSAMSSTLIKEEYAISKLSSANAFNLDTSSVLNWSKLKAFADDKINVREKFKFVLGRLENITGKGENTGYQHFLLFPQCFQKASF